ncbi:MAG: amino acid permease [Candidatus Nanopelagicales bacterium]
MADTVQNDDERRLAELGYKQELNRSWSGFHSFAISFSIISILAGCFTTFAVAWNNGGPIAISIGWPVLSGFILIIGFCMSELLSTYPTSGGIYWWASKLGGPRAGFYTGWLNLVGLLGILASVVYAAAFFLNTTIGLFSASYATDFLGGDYLRQQFFWFIVLMLIVTVLNLFRTEILGVINSISVWWHVIGASVVVLIMVFGPDSHQSLDFVFTDRVNNSGWGDGAIGGAVFWLFVLPLGFLLTQYTITGYDASAHLSEETQAAANGAAKGLWQSIFYSAIGGWILLLSFLFAATQTDFINSFDPAVNPYGGGTAVSIFASSLSLALFKTVMIISTIGQVYCSTACMTSCSRMLFAFSRDGAVPGGRLWTKLDASRVPRNAVLASAIVAVIITLPALYRAPNGVPVAFYAVVSIGVIGLYVAFAIPIWLRWRAGDSFQPGPWTLGRKYKWMCLVAVGEIVITSIYFLLPTVPQGWPGNDDFTWTAVNYTPLVVGGVLLLITIWWFTSAKNWFTGPRRTIDLPEGVSTADELKLEAHGQTAHTDST